MPKTQIASEIDISIRTLYREINRGMVRGLLNSDYSTDAYSAEFAHKKYLESMKSKEGNLKIGKNRKLIEYVENSMLNERNSPYVALEKAKKENIEVNICLKTLYNYIHKQLFINFSEEDMIYKKNRRKQEKIAKRIRKIGGRKYSILLAHSYSLWERGSNENNNKLIRRFIPKGTDISEISEEEIKEIEKWMNDYPRKLFNGKSANEMYLSEFTKYFS